MSPICPAAPLEWGHGGTKKAPPKPPSGHVFRVERKRGPQWFAKSRLPDGRQVQRKVGPAWTERGRPPAGYYTKRTAEDWLRSVLDEARRGTLPGLEEVMALVHAASSTQDAAIYLTAASPRPCPGTVPASTSTSKT